MICFSERRWFGTALPDKPFETLQVYHSTEALLLLEIQRSRFESRGDGAFSGVAAKLSFSH